jgi:hypothetical protein
MVNVAVLANLGVLYLALLTLGGFAVGWWAGRRAPEGTEYRVWLKASRKLTRFRRAIAP